jgi:hypothetical protein
LELLHCLMTRHHNGLVREEHLVQDARGVPRPFSCP